MVAALKSGMRGADGINKTFKNLTDSKYFKGAGELANLMSKKKGMGLGILSKRSKSSIAAIYSHTDPYAIEVLANLSWDGVKSAQSYAVGFFAALHRLYAVFVVSCSLFSLDCKSASGCGSRAVASDPPKAQPTRGDTVVA